jgi:catechol 2,3-dioxygenase-like lactoylglutathione lyase family enzyme
MKLKNILIVVNDIERSKEFYHSLFGLQVIRDFGENVILSEGLVLQEQKNWEKLIKSETTFGNASELFFEEKDFDAFLRSLDNYSEPVQRIGEIRTNSWGKRALQIMDPDGHIIEVAGV